MESNPLIPQSGIHGIKITSMARKVSFFSFSFSLFFLLLFKFLLSSPSLPENRTFLGGNKEFGPVVISVVQDSQKNWLVSNYKTIARTPEVPTLLFSLFSSCLSFPS